VIITGSERLAAVVPRVNVLGVGISAINMEVALTTIEDWIARHYSRYVCVAPVHSVMECRKDAALRRIFNVSGLTTPDGMPLVWLCHLKGYRDVSRVYGPDLMLAICERSIARGYRHFFYGGADGVAEKMAVNLRHRFPGLSVAGTYSPPFRSLTPEEDAEIVRMINEASPDIVWVGLGAPKQERWMAAHGDKLTAPVLIGVGAAFDFHAGLKKQAPCWMQRRGLEWLFRLMTEPRRLWRRYLINNPLFVMLVLLQALGLRRYSLEP
jgi:N-acetylglucosaminyldiphosphoundecaprenol N-acetyl-beta-D-mannosaminyltransferase